MANLTCCGWHQAGGDGTMSCRTLANGRHLLARQGCPTHSDRPAASPSSNLCGPCLMGRVS